jgi:hypothetical protein
VPDSYRCPIRCRCADARVAEDDRIVIRRKGACNEFECTEVTPMTAASSSAGWLPAAGWERKRLWPALRASLLHVLHVTRANFPDRMAAVQPFGAGWSTFACPARRISICRICRTARPEIHASPRADSGKYPIQACLNALKPVKKWHFGVKPLTPGAGRD